MSGRLNAFRTSKAVRFILRLYQRYDNSRLALLAAALAYYAAFSLGPLLLILAGWLGVVLRNRPELSEHYRQVLTNLVAQLVPLQGNSAQLVAQSFETILSQLAEGAVLRSIISFLVLLWASSNFFTVLQLTLEVIFDVPSIRGYWRKRGVAVLLVAAVALVIGIEIIGGLLASSLGQLWTTLASRLLELDIQLPEINLPWVRGLWMELVRLGIATGVFALCFRYLPRKSSTWLGAISGALFSTTSILIMRYIFARSLSLEQFNLIYGVITSLLIVLLWLYFALLIFLIGALLAAEISASLRQAQLDVPEVSS